MPNPFVLFEYVCLYSIFLVYVYRFVSVYSFFCVGLFIYFWFVDIVFVIIDDSL